MLLAQHLASAVASPPLQKVRLICEAAWMVPPGKLSLDMYQVETMYTVALGFLNVNVKSEFLAVAWGFGQTQENYDRFIKPWHRDIPLYFNSVSDADREEKRERLKKSTGESESFFLLTGHLNLFLGSLAMLKSEFLRWAVPQAMGIFEQLSRLVDPDLYKEMLGIVKAKAESG